MPVKIITDSTCDITQREAKTLGLEVVPMTVSFGDEQFLDGITLSVEEFYEKLQQAKHSPKSSQPSPSQFYTVFEKYVDEGYDIVCVLISSLISGTLQSAQIAKNDLGKGNIHLVDSMSTSLVQGSLAMEAARMAEQGKSAEEIVEAIEAKKTRPTVIVAIDTFKYLVLGGRISGATALVGSMLGVKPIVAILDGVVKNITKVRGMKMAAKQILEMCVEKGLDIAETVYVLHANNIKGGEAFMDMLRDRFEGIKLVLAEVGATIGTHAGPGAFGVVFYCK